MTWMRIVVRQPCSARRLLPHATSTSLFRVRGDAGPVLGQEVTICSACAERSTFANTSRCAFSCLATVAMCEPDSAGEAHTC